MTDLVEELVRALPPEPPSAWARLKRRLARSVAAEAPPGYDEAMAQIRPLPGWMRLLLLAGVCAASWAGLILGLARLLR